MCGPCRLYLLALTQEIFWQRSWDRSHHQQRFVAAFNTHGNKACAEVAQASAHNQCSNGCLVHRLSYPAQISSN